MDREDAMSQIENIVELDRQRRVRQGRPHITVMHYNKEEAQEYEVLHPETYHFEQRSGMITWIDIDGAADPDILKTLCDDLDLKHTLLMDVGTGLRPRVEEHPSYFHIVLRMMQYKHIDSKEIVTEQVHLLLGKDFVVSVQEGEEGDVFNGVR